MAVASPKKIRIGSSRRRIARRVYALGRILSIDVSLAALSAGVMAERATGGIPRPSFYVLLPLSVWMVYTFDHLMDARRMGPGAHTPRHRFHHLHARVLWPLCAIGAAICAVIGIASLSWLGVKFGIALAALVGAHELLVKLAGGRASVLLLKEVGVAGIFTAGTWGLPLLLHIATTGHIRRWQAVLVLQYLLLALANLVVFSLLEVRSDELDRQTNVVRAIGTGAGRATAGIILAAQAPLGAAALAIGPTPLMAGAELIYAVMAAVLGAILLFPFFRHHGRYRAWGDGVFLLPILMAVFTGRYSFTAAVAGPASAVAVISTKSTM